MEEMRELRKNNPRVWHFAKLGHRYGISALSASKIIDSKFVPTPHQRVTRWLEREEFKRIQTKVLRTIAKEQRTKLIEEDLKTRYGRLYSPPPKVRKDPIIQKLLRPSMEQEETDEDESDEENEEKQDTHENELRRGGLLSLYRRISVEAKAVVSSQLEVNLAYQKAFAKDVNRIQREEQLKKEETQFLEEKEKKPQREFFKIFEDEEFTKATAKVPKSFQGIKDKPWRMKQITSRKSTRIKQWPKDLLPNQRTKNKE